MGLVELRSIRAGSKIGVWEIIESEQELTDVLDEISEEERLRISAFKNEGARVQRMAVRKLLRAMLKDTAILEYDVFGKPRIRSSKLHLSISHSRSYAVVQLHPSMSVGIDIQPITLKMDRIKEKFMSNEELVQCDSSGPVKLHVYWGAKEALYKIYGKGGLIFAKELRIQHFNFRSGSSGTIFGEIRREGHCKMYELGYEQIGDHMLVHTNDVMEEPHV